MRYKSTRSQFEIDKDEEIKLGIAARLRDARIQSGRTQDEVANLVDVTFQAISGYERGKTNIEITLLVKICEILNADLRYILTGEKHGVVKNETSITEDDLKIALFGTNKIEDQELIAIRDFSETIRKRLVKEGKL